MVRRGLPIMHRTRPVRTRHGACRQVDQPRIRRMRAGIDRNLSRNADGEVPCRQRGVRWRRAANGRALQLAIVVSARRFVASGGNAARKISGSPGGAVVTFACASPPSPSGACGACVTAMSPSMSSVRRHVVPSPLQQPARHFRPQQCPIRTGDFRHRAAARADAQSEMSSHRCERDQALPTFPRCGGPDRRRQAKPHPADRPAAMRHGRSCRARHAAPCRACVPSIALGIGISA